MNKIQVICKRTTLLFPNEEEHSFHEFKHVSHAYDFYNWLCWKFKDLSIIYNHVEVKLKVGNNVVLKWNK